MSDPFPNRTDRNFQPTSPATPLYNCAAWAIHVENQAIWPDEDEQLGWPPDLPRNETLENFVTFFERAGFEESAHGLLEKDTEKIAIYGSLGEVHHVARQLGDGSWTSKMGGGVDAVHLTREVLEGGPYGDVQIIMKRSALLGPPKTPQLNPSPGKLFHPYTDQVLFR